MAAQREIERGPAIHPLTTGAPGTPGRSPEYVRPDLIVDAAASAAQGVNARMSALQHCHMITDRLRASHPARRPARPLYFEEPSSRRYDDEKMDGLSPPIRKRQRLVAQFPDHQRSTPGVGPGVRHRSVSISVPSMLTCA
jgi:hypothetical protein